MLCTRASNNCAAHAGGACMGLWLAYGRGWVICAHACLKLCALRAGRACCRRRCTCAARARRPPPPSLTPRCALCTRPWARPPRAPRRLSRPRLHTLRNQTAQRMAGRPCGRAAARRRSRRAAHQLLARGSAAMQQTARSQRAAALRRCSRAARKRTRQAAGMRAAACVAGRRTAALQRGQRAQPSPVLLALPVLTRALAGRSAAPQTCARSRRGRP